MDHPNFFQLYISCVRSSGQIPTQLWIDPATLSPPLETDDLQYAEINGGMYRKNWMIDRQLCTICNIPIPSSRYYDAIRVRHNQYHAIIGSEVKFNRITMRALLH